MQGAEFTRAGLSWCDVNSKNFLIGIKSNASKNFPAYPALLLNSCIE